MVIVPQIGCVRNRDLVIPVQTIMKMTVLSKAKLLRPVTWLRHAFNSGVSRIASRLFNRDEMTRPGVAALKC